MSRPCACGIPSKANFYVEVIYGRNIPGGTETGSSETYWCGDHAPSEDAVRLRLELDEGRDAIVVPSGFEILEWKTVELR